LLKLALNEINLHIIYKGSEKMKTKNLRINISFKNNLEDMKIYAFMQTKRDKSSYIKDLLEVEMKKIG